MNNISRVFVYGYDAKDSVVAQTEVVLSPEKWNAFIDEDIYVDNALSLIQDAAITAGMKTKIERTLVVFIKEI